MVNKYSEEDYYKIFDKKDDEITLLNKYCIETLKHNLYPKKFPKPKFPKKYKSNINVGVFVTWLDETKEYKKRLRGCIGTFWPDEIEKQLSTYTIISAREDTRFKSVDVEELNNFSMSVSILLPMEECADPYDWELGIHGVYVKFNANNKNYSACYLPEVPGINNWDKELTLDRCVKKSGYSKELGHLKEVISSMVVLKFKSVKSSVKCSDYLN